MADEKIRKPRPQMPTTRPSQRGGGTERPESMTQQQRIHVYEPGTSALLLQTIEANVDNDKLSDEEFRQFIRNSLPTAQKDES